MAKKKASSKKTTNDKASGKSASSKKSGSGKSKPAKPAASKSNAAPSGKSDVKTATRPLAKPNGTSGGGKKSVETKSSVTKKIAGGGGNEGLRNFKAKANGSHDDKGLNPQTYQMLRQDIISTLWKYDEITFDELCAAMEKIHGKNFVSDSLKYIRQVVSDLINIELIEQIDRDASRSIYRIRQRLSE